MPRTMVDAWRRTVRLDPAARALVDAAGREYSRRDLAEAAANWTDRHPDASGLRGAIVTLAEPNGLGWWSAFLALLELGAIPALVDASEPIARQMEIAAALGAGAMVREGRLHCQAARPRRPQARIALIKLTSGSSGRPTARQFTDAQMIADGRHICDTMAIRAADLNLAVIPLGHSYGLGNLVLPLLLQGTAMVCGAMPLPHALADVARRWQPTVFPAVPTLLRGLVRSQVEPGAFRSLRLVISAGAPLSADIAAEFAAKFHRRVHGFYGTTETGGISYDRDGEATLAGRSVGTPLRGVRLERLRGRRFRVCSAAALRGAFTPADRGVMNEAGEVVLLGRTGRTIKIGSRRLDLGELESALRSIPGVRDAFGAPGVRADTCAVAVSTDLELSALQAAARDRLASWKVPDRWLLLSAFPVTARGKVDRSRLEHLLRPSAAATT